MDELKNYLELMFSRLPETAEVRRAKDELGQMMEDKYTELLEDGVSRNEAIGTVISEFGNLDDLADQLGIRNYLMPVAGPGNGQRTESGGNGSSGTGRTGADSAAPGGQGGNAYSGSAGGQSFEGGFGTEGSRIISTDEAEPYLKEATKISILRGAGVALCILCVIGQIFFGEIGDHLPLIGWVFRLVGNLIFFGFIAAGVYCFIRAGKLEKRWEYIFKGRCVLDAEAQDFTMNRLSGIREGLSRFRTIGIILCAVCWLPAAIMDGVFGYEFGFLADLFQPTMLFLMVGIGAGLIVLSSGIESAHKKLLKADLKERKRALKRGMRV